MWVKVEPSDYLDYVIIYDNLFGNIFARLLFIPENIVEHGLNYFIYFFVK